MFAGKIPGNHGTDDLCGWLEPRLDGDSSVMVLETKEDSSSLLELIRSRLQPPLFERKAFRIPIFAIKLVLTT